VWEGGYAWLPLEGGDRAGGRVSTRLARYAISEAPHQLR
jgi:hypothetical protein